MSEFDDAVARLELAVARLEAAASHPARAADERASRIATSVAARLDAALAKLGQLLDRED